MASITVETTKEERQKVLDVLAEIGEVVVPVSAIAIKAGLNSTKTRYVLLDLVESGAIQRVPTKAFNKHYVRYYYKILTRQIK
jgi:DNA-binding IclR family transcriptional regulator